MHKSPRLPLAQIRPKLLHKMLMPDKGRAQRFDLAVVVAHEVRIKLNEHHSHIWLIWDGPIGQDMSENRPIQRVIPLSCSPISKLVEGDYAKLSK